MSTPYDPKKTAEYLKIAGGHASSPMGEFLMLVAEQLRLADEEIRGAAGRVSLALTAQNRAESELETAHATNKRLREGSSGLQEATDALKAIARNPKGSARVAKEALEKMGA